MCIALSSSPSSLCSPPMPTTSNLISQFPCDIHGAGCIGRLTVSSDLSSGGCRHGGTADHYLHRVTQSCFFQRFDHGLCVDHRRGQKDAHPQYTGLILTPSVHKAISLHIHPGSIVSKPAPSSIILTRFLPMSCKSLSPVPMTYLPTLGVSLSASSGRKMSMPACIARAMSTSGKKAR